jgi:membrane protease YdiL (CAAX protease family)
MFIIVFVFLLAAFVINRRTFSIKTSSESKAIENTIFASVIFFILWLLIDQILIPGYWWSLKTEYILPSILLSLAFVFLNILLYVWYMGGTDYKPLYDAGVITDNCPYNGTWSIPANFVTHAAQVLWEEIFFRGFIGIVLYLWLGLVPAVVIPTIIFGLMHYLPFRAFALQNNRYVFGSLVSTTVFPTAFMVSTVAFQSLVPAWIMHTFLNCSVGLYLRYIRPIMMRTSYAR